MAWQLAPKYLTLAIIGNKPLPELIADQYVYCHMVSLGHNELNSTVMKSLLCLLTLKFYPSSHIIKTHVHGFFDTDLHEVSWHFATHEAVRPSSTDRMKISVKEAIQNGFLFLSHT